MYERNPGDRRRRSRGGWGGRGRAQRGGAGAARAACARPRAAPRAEPPNDADVPSSPRGAAEGASRCFVAVSRERAPRGPDCIRRRAVRCGRANIIAPPHLAGHAPCNVYVSCCARASAELRATPASFFSFFNSCLQWQQQAVPPDMGIFQRPPRASAAARARARAPTADCPRRPSLSIRASWWLSWIVITTEAGGGGARWGGARGPK